MSGIAGDWVIEKIGDQKGDLYVAGNIICGGTLSAEGFDGDSVLTEIPAATTKKLGGVVVGEGLTVTLKSMPVPGKKTGQIDLDFLTLEQNTDLYNPRDTTHPVHAAAAYNLGHQAAWAVITERLASRIEAQSTSGGGAGPLPTAADDEIPTAAAVAEYVDEAVASAVADGLGAAREIYTFTGDGVKKSFPIQHTLGEKDVLAAVLDAAGNGVLVRVVFQSVGNLLVMFADPPAAGETFTIVLCK